MDDLENKDPFASYYESGGKKKQHIHFPNSTLNSTLGRKTAYLPD